MRGVTRNLASLSNGLKFSECLQQSRGPSVLANLRSESTRPEERILPHFTGISQHLRKYASTTSGESPECWNCKQKTQRKSHMLCSGCGYLQDVNDDVNYFELLNFPRSYAVEQQELTKRFRQLQTLVHPDKFSNKTSREQNNSADWSSLINKAYKTLSAPIERGQYLLRLHGQQIPQDNSALDKHFLMEMMERNEEVEEAESSDDLEQLSKRIAQELKEKSKDLSAQFEADALDAAKALIVQMKYLMSIQKSIKNKLQKLMGS